MTTVEVERAAPVVNVVRETGEVTVTREIANVTVTRSGLPGPAGPEGPVGQTGPPGTGIATTIVHNQLLPSAEWTIIHGLGRYPSVTIVDSAGTVVIGGLRYLDENTVVVSFNYQFSGKAYLN